MVRLVSLARKPEVVVCGDENANSKRSGSKSGDLRLHASIPIWEGVSDVLGGGGRGGAEGCSRRVLGVVRVPWFVRREVVKWEVFRVVRRRGRGQ